MKRIQISHIAKIEGHAGFVADLIKGDVKKARVKVKEGARLIEAILIGRNFSEAPVITARICGVCPVVHNLTSIKALEKALGVKPNNLVVLLRKLMMAAQIIHSHTLHIFLLSLSDFFGFNSDIELVKAHPYLIRNVFSLRKWGNKVIEKIGGRSIHPLTPQIGGFSKVPSYNSLKDLQKEIPDLIKKAELLFSFLNRLDLPQFERKTEYLALDKKNEYAIYEGDILFSSGEKIKASQFTKNIKEIERPYLVVKRVYHKQKPYMVGALARLNIHGLKLNPKAKKLYKKYFPSPCYNPFYNIWAQMIEVIHLLEEAQKLIKRILKYDLKKALVGPLKIKKGKGGAAMEAPRGTLFHFYEINKQGIIENVNIITPTAQFLANLEEDLKEYLPHLKKISAKEKRRKISMLVRAYDPCMTCATH